MLLKLNEVVNNKTYDINIDLERFNETYKADVIKSFNKIDGIISVTKLDKIFIINFKFKADLTLISTFSLKEFKKTLIIKEDLYVTNDEEFESEQTFYYDSDIDLDNLIFSLILTSLPISIKAPGDKNIEGEGYRVISEEELEKENRGNSAFDCLSDLEFDDDEEDEK